MPPADPKACQPPGCRLLSGTSSRHGHHGRERPSDQVLQTLFPPTPLPIATGHSSGVRPWEQLAGERGLLGRGLTAPSSNKEPALARRLLPSPYGRRGPARGGVTAGPTCSAHTHAGRGAPLLLQAGAGGRGRRPGCYFCSWLQRIASPERKKRQPVPVCC